MIEVFAIERLARVLSPQSDWEKRKFCMLVSYFDASGTSHDQPVLTIAGFISSANDWKDFSEAWLNQIRPAEYFHRTEFNRAWRGKPKSEKECVLQELEAIIASHVYRSFSVTVLNKPFTKILSGEDRKRWKLEAYSFAGRACASQIKTWCERERIEFPELIFESGDQFHGYFSDRMKADGFDEPIFRDKKKYAPLQAADFLAWEIFTLVKNAEQIEGYSASTIFKSLIQIPGSDSWKVTTMESMDRVKEMLSIEERIQRWVKNAGLYQPIKAGNSMNTKWKL